MAVRFISKKAIKELVEALTDLVGANPVGATRMLQRAEAILLVEVRDHGIGMPTDETDTPKLCIVYEVLGTVRKAVRDVQRLPEVFEIGLHDMKKRYAVRYEDVHSTGYPC